MGAERWKKRCVHFSAPIFLPVFDASVTAEVCPIAPVEDAPQTRREEAQAALPPVQSAVPLQAEYRTRMPTRRHLCPNGPIESRKPAPVGDVVQRQCADQPCLEATEERRCSSRLCA